ncbi:MAG: phosphoribosylformylglycinamidine synthase subunit PurL [Candidatus Xenobia bacterium]
MTASTLEAGQALGLSIEEYRRIVDILGRDPSPTELAMFSVEWSEHCGYPRSRSFLSLLPREGRFKPVVGSDAGGFELDGRLVVFKVESHNHPSQVEPRAGAMTGVGGIIRDIVSMGARPVALLDALKFGAAEDPSTAFFVKGVVDGIQFYGNCIGIPTVGGEVQFDNAYAGNCLVNAMCVGVVEPGGLMTSKAQPGKSVMYLGATTGRDGIGGCSVLASKEFGAEDAKRPTVQIGDPFAGKCLLEATLEAIATGALVALKDMGAAGLTCTTAESAEAGDCGMDVELQHVPRRESGMEPYEVMMSESQERMLGIVEPGREEEVARIFRRWGLQAAVIGHTVKAPVLTIRDQGEVVAKMPVEELTHPKPIPLPQEAIPPRPAPPAPTPSGDWAGDLLKLMASPNLSSRRWIFRQYDHMVQTATVLRPGDADASVVRLHGSQKGLAVRMDSCARQAWLDPFEGARHAVAEACRNVACVGGEPAGLTDCLNFGNPEKPDRFWQLVRSIEGIADACRTFGIPVVSGNVSLYNESPQGAVLPTATVGVVGVVEDVSRTARSAFSQEGDVIALIGETKATSLLNSEYAVHVHGTPLGGPPTPLDLKEEIRVQETVRQAVRQGLVRTAHDCSDGGLLAALAECCVGGSIGATVTLQGDVLSYFGEAPSRIVVAGPAESVQQIPGARAIGRVGGDKLQVDDFSISVEALRDAWESLPQVLKI